MISRDLFTQALICCRILATARESASSKRDARTMSFLEEKEVELLPEREEGREEGKQNERGG